MALFCCSAAANAGGYQNIPGCSRLNMSLTNGGQVAEEGIFKVINDQ